MQNRFNALLSIFICLIFIVLIGTGEVKAQIGVFISIEKNNIIPYEPIKITVELDNRAGSDIFFNNEDGNKWIDFDITGSDGKKVLPAQQGEVFAPLTLRFGEKKRILFNLGQVYPISESGFYSIKAVVYHHGFKSYFNSNTVRVNANSGNVMWAQTAAVPEGEPDAGTVRRFRAITLRQRESTNIYVRIDDEKTGYVHSIATLGRIILSKKTNFLIDRESRMHLLFMTAPHIYRHYIITSNGKIDSGELYKDSKFTEPLLVSDNQGFVRVNGGIKYDPDAVSSRFDQRIGIPLSKIPITLQKALRER